MRGTNHQELVAAEVERGAHRETMEALEMSENSVSEDVNEPPFQETFSCLQAKKKKKKNPKPFFGCTFKSFFSNLSVHIHKRTYFCSQQYFALLRAISASLEVREVDELRSMAHIPSDERQRLMMQREQICELLSTRIKVLSVRSP